MKKIIYSVVVCTILSISTTALFGQGKPMKMPMDNKASVETFLKDVYTAYEKMNYKNLKSYYDRQAGEISPDGSMVQGLKNLQVSWKAFDAMVDERPSFTYQLTSSRMVSDDIAVITWDSEANIKVKGQQVGGPAIGMAVLKKKNNGWIIVFDTITPVMPAPPVAPEAPEAMPEAAPQADPSDD